MIDRKELLSDLQRLLKKLEKDLLDRSTSTEVPEVGETLKKEYDEARRAERTAQTFEEWRSDQITRMAAAWVLSCVFARFLEDNALVDPPRLSGPVGDRLNRARDEHELYFQAPGQATHSDRDYLLRVFEDLAQLPGGRDVFGPHNGIHFLPRWLGPDAAGELLRFFQKIIPDSGDLLHDFTDVDWDTRFLGDLYQDLSEEARKRYALLQTPEFVEEFILERTLEPALDEFGLDAPPVLNRDGNAITAAGFRMIDPACGSGHFLLGAFHRILDRWQRTEPATNPRELARRALESVFGVDINPFAAAIARFRLLVAALKACGITRLADTPAFPDNVAAGDSLLHGAAAQSEIEFEEFNHYYGTEDAAALRRIMQPGIHHAVVANPPYITVKDRFQNEAYRIRYACCSGKYSLAVPFMERIFNLAVRGNGCGGGYTGQITANSFMKREFGKKLVEEFLPQWDLTHVIDTSGASIPGHGTPTVILFGRNQSPLQPTLRAVLGIRGESSTPEVPANGLVWLAILAQIDQPGSESEFISSIDSTREMFNKHPWCIGGGGASELRSTLDAGASLVLSDMADTGIGVVTLEDEAYQLPADCSMRHALPVSQLRMFGVGDTFRDWQAEGLEPAVFPYKGSKLVPEIQGDISNWLWPLRTGLANRLWFRKTQTERGLNWYEYGYISRDKLSTSLSIAFAAIATHNHFVLDRGGTVFKQSAPIIKIESVKADHLSILGLLNSSITCFWMKQVMHGKHKGDGGEAHADPAYQRFDFDGSKLKQFPISADKPLALPTELDRLAQTLKDYSPEAALAGWRSSGDRLAAHLAAAERDSAAVRERMISLQEELDWQCYRFYGLTTAAEDLEWPEPDLATLPPISLGQRPFEIVLARAVAAGDEQTTWFERHAHAGSRAITELPAHWPADYRALVERRIAKIASEKNIGLIEKPEFKRRWNTEPWADRQQDGLRQWLLGRLESYFDFDGRMNDAGTPTGRFDIELVSVARLAAVAEQDEQFHEAGALYRDDPAFRVQDLVRDLVEAESVPLLPVLRYKESGLIKRTAWERTWDLQRQEDAIDARSQLPTDDPDYLDVLQARALKQGQIGDIPVPPKYKSTDFLNTTFWRLRGKLDVPKERWVSFPHCEGPDGTLVVAWAGYDHLQLARAVGTWFAYIQQEVGGQDDPRLLPLLASLVELLPWLKQWHNTPDSEFGPMGNYFESFLQEQARLLGTTVSELQAWQPPSRTTGGRRSRRVTTAQE